MKGKTYMEWIALGSILRPLRNDATVWPLGLGKRLQEEKKVEYVSELSYKYKDANIMLNWN